MARGSSFILVVLVLLGCASGTQSTTVAAQDSESPTERATPETSEISAAAETRPTATPEPAPATSPPLTPTPIPKEQAVPTPSPTAEEPDNQPCVRLAEFVSPREIDRWRTVNDGVMGGRSSGGPAFGESTMRFIGEINTNGGGFSSVRFNLFPGALEGFDKVVVRARTDGRTYKLTFDDSLPGRDRRISHQGNLVFEGVDDWQLATVSFSDLQPSLFGREVETEPFRNDLAVELGVMISDGVDGPFEIEVDWIAACQAK